MTSSFASQVIPKELQQKWQKELEALDTKLGGTPEKPTESLLIMLEAPEEMVVLCTAGMKGHHLPNTVKNGR